MNNTNPNSCSYNIVAILLATGLFLSPLLYFEPLFAPSELPRYALISLLAILTTPLLLLKLWRNKLEHVWHPINFAIIIFAVLTTVSGLWALDSGGYYLSIIPFIAVILIYFVASHYHQYSMLFLGASLAAALYAAIIGLLQSYQLDPFDYRDASIMASTFSYKNHAALYFDLIIPASLALVLITKNSLLRWATAVSSAICLAYVIETHTRGSWLALGVTLLTVCYLLVSKKQQLSSVIDAIKKTKFELLVIVIISTALVYNPSHMDESWSRDSQYGEAVLDTSSSNRLVIYKNAISMLQNNPMGVGFGSFWKGFREYTNYPNIIPLTDANIIVYRAHSEPLQYFLELGIVGGLLVIFIFFYLMTTGVKTILLIEDTKHKILCLGISASILTSAIHGVVDFPLHKPSSALQFWLLAGLLIGYAASLKNEKRTFNPNLKNGILASFGVVLCIFAPLSVKLYAAHIPGSIHHQNAVLATNENCEVATNEIEKSLAYSAYYFRTHSTRVDIHFRCETNNEKLLAVLKQELAIDGNNVKALLKVAYIYLDKGNFAAAHKNFKKISLLLPHKVYGRYGIAQIMLLTGNIQSGIKELKKIIKTHPDFEDAKLQLQSIEKLVKNARPKPKQ